MTRTATLTLILISTLALGASAQEPTTTTTTTAAPAAEVTTTAEAAPETSEPVRRSSYEVRNEFSHLLREHPPELAMTVKLEPTLLTNEAFLARYPEVAEYVGQHPEIRQNPHFYLGEFIVPGVNDSIVDEIVEMLAVMTGFGLAIFAFAWLVRTVIEQRRWNRLSRTQAEVHNKILDRFSTSAELLEYIRTPAGTKFLESAPIPLHAESPSNIPGSRIIWSVQLGVVVMAAAVGLLLISFRFTGDEAQAFFALGAIAFCIGGGFIASAAVSLFLSRRLGLWAGAAPRLDESEPVR